MNKFFENPDKESVEFGYQPGNHKAKVILFLHFTINCSSIL